MDVGMPDVCVVGGITEMDAVSKLADSRGALVSPHGPFGPVALLAAAQVMAAQANFLTLEFGWGVGRPWRSALLEPAEVVRDGRLVLPRGDGLGARLVESVAAAHQREVLPPAGAWRRRLPRKRDGRASPRL